MSEQEEHVLKYYVHECQYVCVNVIKNVMNLVGCL